MKLAEDGKLAEDASALVERLSTASADLAAVASRLQKGEGTLGKLSADSKLYDEVTALVKDIRQVVDNYRDTTPISSFGSLIGGALCWRKGFRTYLRTVAWLQGGIPLR